MPKVLTNLDLNQNEIQNAVLHPLPSPPLNPVEGQIYYNSTDNLIYQWDGTKWLGENIKILNNAIENNGIGYIADTTNVVLPETTITDYFYENYDIPLVFQTPIRIGKNYKVTINNQVYHNITAIEDYVYPCLQISDHPAYGNLSIFSVDNYNNSLNNLLHEGAIIHWGESSTSSITISIELYDEEPIYSQIDKTLLPYGDIISQAVEFNQLGWIGWRTIIDTTVTNWIYDDDGAWWYCQFACSDIFHGDMLYSMPIIIEYNNNVIKLINGSNNAYLGADGYYCDPVLAPLKNQVRLHQNSSSGLITFAIHLASNIQNVNSILGNFPIKIKIPGAIERSNPQLTSVYWNNVIDRPSSIYYARCSTSSTTTIKDITINHSISYLYYGLCVRILFHNSCGNLVPQLKVNNITKTIYIRYGSSTVLAPTNCWLAGEVKDFVYGDGVWILINPTLLSDSVSDTSTTYAATANAVKTAYDLANTANTKYYLNTSVTFNATKHDATTSPSAVSYNNTANKSIDLGYYITATNSSNVGAVIGTTSTTTSSLTISLNGTSQGAWNGSSDKGINITPTAIGAAALASPGFTGVPTAPTAAVSSNSTQIATTAFVQAAIQDAIMNAINASY